MNLSSHYSILQRFIFQAVLNCRKYLRKKKSISFGVDGTTNAPKISHIYVINLARHTKRLGNMKNELKHVLDCSGVELWNLTERFDAVDAVRFLRDPIKDNEVDPIYSLGDQLYVEPQPLAIPAKYEYDSPIRMSRAEIAVARSHIEIWKIISANKYDYVLILEDDVWFQPGFAKYLDNAWSEIHKKSNKHRKFDILYLSYKEVKHGAPKMLLSRNLFCPSRGLWYLSGYVLSKEGAKKLLELLPCKGPVDLWMNHQFKSICVLATRKSIISQRSDTLSSNSYSILPALTKIGAINSESAALFHIRPTERPVFAFGERHSGLTSLAMALSMLGYRCCHDLQALPDEELQRLFEDRTDRIFDAYVNIGSITTALHAVIERYPKAKYILTRKYSEQIDDNIKNIYKDLNGLDVVFLHLEAENKWQILCEHLKCAPPASSFPELADEEQRKLSSNLLRREFEDESISAKRDNSPWVIERTGWWKGIRTVSEDWETFIERCPVVIEEDMINLDNERWVMRDDTFSGNMGLFRPSNIELNAELGAILTVKRESLGVREYSAAALTSRERYLYGKYEAVIKASDVPGVVSGIFLHRDSPRQEIDIEITGNRTDRMIANVFYNPGAEGAKYDYGYRGAASYIDLGFDASESYHLYTIIWASGEIRWLVDNRLVHVREIWDPTPIPNLPMSFHVNLWPTRSRELAGRLSNRWLPAKTILRSISIKSFSKISK